MARELLTRCGYRCDLCLAYVRNIEKKDLRKELSAGWQKCFGFTIPPEQILCEGCCSPGTPKLVDTDCPVRPCVIGKRLANCAECNDYPCGKFLKRQVIFEEVARGKDISAKERELFILPYENRVRLDVLRAQR